MLGAGKPEAIMIWVAIIFAWLVTPFFFAFGIVVAGLWWSAFGTMGNTAWFLGLYFVPVCACFLGFPIWLGAMTWLMARRVDQTV